MLKSAQFARLAVIFYLEYTKRDGAKTDNALPLDWN